MAAKSETFNSNPSLRIYKQNMMLKFMEIESNEPKLTQKKRFQNNYDFLIVLLNDIERILIRIVLIKEKNTNSNTSITETQTHTPSENTKSNKNTENKKKNIILKGGSILEDQGEKSNYITIAKNVF